MNQNNRAYGSGLVRANALAIYRFKELTITTIIINRSPLFTLAEKTIENVLLIRTVPNEKPSRKPSVG